MWFDDVSQQKYAARTKATFLLKVISSRGVKLFLDFFLQASKQVFLHTIPLLQVVCAKHCFFNAQIVTPHNLLMLSSMPQASNEMNVLEKWDSSSTWLNFWEHSSFDAIKRIDECLCIRIFFFRHFSIFGFSNSNPNSSNFLFSFNNLKKMGIKRLNF